MSPVNLVLLYAVTGMGVCGFSRLRSKYYLTYSQKPSDRRETNSPNLVLLNYEIITTYCPRDTR